MEIVEIKNNELRSGSIIVKNTLWILAARLFLSLLLSSQSRYSLTSWERNAWCTYISMDDYRLFQFVWSRIRKSAHSGSRKNLGGQEKNNLTDIAWTAQLVILVLGVIGAIVLWLLSPLLVQSFLKIPQSLQSETLKSFHVLALSIPLLTSSAGLCGILMAYRGLILSMPSRSLWEPFLFSVRYLFCYSRPHYIR